MAVLLADLMAARMVENLVVARAAQKAALRAVTSVGQRAALLVELLVYSRAE
jgi:hypothetical protein